MGVMYICGRTRDYVPIVVTDFAAFGRALDQKKLDLLGFCQLTAFLDNYVINNMLLPGQVEGYI